LLTIVEIFLLHEGRALAQLSMGLVLMTALFRDVLPAVKQREKRA